MKWLFFFLLLGSCRQEQAIPNQCGVNNPLTELPWLQKLASNKDLGVSIVQGTYQNQTVYAVYSCGRCFAGPYVSVYRCDGSSICSGLVVDKSSAGCTEIARNLSDKQTLLNE
ncbi:hypothetical protein [Spirosoma linguale]|uniref:Uncharacterized protein n=1 Tax=Spirosoma linguale (strain ATCC 33905 / DSM 74 / LMG 10896 / Claus 1) TaxID=504472 RepID=D2QIP8_SPILD|nr:hypothetical protein Slin_3984 [Spirosoma linguale DSM 74]